MKDLTGTMNLAVSLAQRISEITAALEPLPDHAAGDDGAKISVAGGCVLWHVASARLDYSSGEFRSRRRAAESLGSARSALIELSHLILSTGEGCRLGEAQEHELLSFVAELQTVVTTLNVEIRGNRLVA